MSTRCPPANLSSRLSVLYLHIWRTFRYISRFDVCVCEYYLHASARARLFDQLPISLRDAKWFFSIFNRIVTVVEPCSVKNGAIIIVIAAHDTHDARVYVLIVRISRASNESQWCLFFFFFHFCSALLTVFCHIERYVLLRPACLGLPRRSLSFIQLFHFICVFKSVECVYECTLDCERE